MGVVSAGWAAACPVGPGGRGRKMKPRDAGGSGRAGAAGLGGERVQVGPPPDPPAAQTRTWWVGVVPPVTPPQAPELDTGCGSLDLGAGGRPGQEEGRDRGVNQGRS